MFTTLALQNLHKSDISIEELNFNIENDNLIAERNLSNSLFQDSEIREDFNSIWSNLLLKTAQENAEHPSLDSDSVSPSECFGSENHFLSWA